MQGGPGTKPSPLYLPSRRNEAPAQLCSEGANLNRLRCTLAEVLRFGGSALICSGLRALYKTS